MAANNNRGGGDVEMRYSSSPTSLSSPPSGSISSPRSPSRLNQGRANIEMDEIVVDTAAGPRFGVIPQHPQQPQPEVQLTAAGLPRKKPGRKPGTVVKKAAAAGDASSTTTDAPKVRKPRKPRDPNAPPIQRKRKIAATLDGTADAEQQRAASTTPADSAARQTKITELMDPAPLAPAAPITANQDPIAPKVPKREAMPGSMMSLLNRDPSPPPRPAAAPVRPGAMAFDPVRSSSYDPVRETMMTRDPYGTAGLTSPRGPTNQLGNRASASPSIASLVDPPTAAPMTSPTPSQQTFQHTTTQSRFQDLGSVPPSPPNALRSAPQPQASKATVSEAKKPTVSQSVSAPAKASESIKFNAMTTISGMAAPTTTASAPSKKVASVVAQERKEKKASSSSSSPKLGALKNSLPEVPALSGTTSDRSILDFGKANPGEEFVAPSIVLHIPLNGETNKYVNFMRMAEEQYGWDALHPRQAAHRERKARIAAASAALEKQGSGRESGDEMSVDLQSDGEGSNVEMGGMGNGGASGADGAPAKPTRKKRIFKEDEYDKDDDFVDDSELLWEEQAAASRDGFFVYSGPLVPEVEKPAAGTDGPPKRGRGGRGSRGGARGGASGRGGAEGGGEGKRRGGGPGSRGGVARKPRITKQEKLQLDREKAEREKLAQMASKNGSGLNVLQTSPSFAAGMVGDH
ncbi:Histone promoter control protein 2 [Pleurostoma richardsiae]|uniref:Histone promoter control protein 2 n=1 Tax=Pleurostoma richardsiae TaxID=41990 RepID=A0AA38S0Z3_9PEZI|nr:Histone promoter control protein 2 [Pleurostoma richardsiae]